MDKYEAREIECPCDYIVDGEIDTCTECPYIERNDENEQNS